MKTVVRILLALAIATLANVANAFDPKAACVYADNVEWKRWGGAPYGPTAAEALTDPKLDWYLKCSTAIPEHLKAKVKAAIRANPKGEQMAYLTPDMTLPEMASGPDRSHRTQHIMRNVKVARIVEVLGIVLAAETPIWSVKDTDGSTFVVGDPLRCGNLSVIRIIPVPTAVVQVPKCYTIPFDYQNTPGVVWDGQHRAHVLAHLNVPEKELEAISSDPCFFVADAKGSRKPFNRCELCEKGEYPPPPLARAVGLPEEKPGSVLSFHLQDGAGHFSLPPAWAARWMLFCVDVTPYSISVPEYRHGQALSRFDTVEKKEVEDTLPKGTLGRALSGARHY